MDITVYLPDGLGERAKAEKLPFSQLLRAAVVDELNRRAAVQSLLSKTHEYVLEVEDKDGRCFKGRIEGRLIAEDKHGATVYVTADERVILYDESKLKFWVLDDPEDELRGELDTDAYIEAMNALGVEPTVDL